MATVRAMLRKSRRLSFKQVTDGQSAIPPRWKRKTAREMIRLMAVMISLFPRPLSKSKRARKAGRYLNRAEMTQPLALVRNFSVVKVRFLSNGWVASAEAGWQGK